MKSKKHLDKKKKGEEKNGGGGVLCSDISNRNEAFLLLIRDLII